MRESWQRTELGELLEQLNDRCGKVAKEPLILSVTKHHGIVPADSFFINRVASRKVDDYKVVATGDFAYSTIHIDEGAVAFSRQPAGVVSPMYTVMRIKSQLAEPEFLELLLQSESLIREYVARAAGSINRRRSLPFAKFARIEVPLPPLAEQRRFIDVVATIDRQAALVHAQSERALELLSALRRRLDVTEEKVSLGEFLEDIQGGRSPATLDRLPMEGERAVLKVSAIRPGTFVSTEAKALADDVEMPDQAVVRDGDLLITRANTAQLVGAVCRVSESPDGLYLSDKTLRLVIDEEIGDPEFFVHALATPDVRRQLALVATGTSGSMKNVSQAKLRALIVPAPPLDRQRELARTLNGVVRVIAACERRATALKRLRKSAVETLLSGAHEIPESYDRLLPEGRANVDLEPTTV